MYKLLERKQIIYQLNTIPFLRSLGLTSLNQIPDYFLDSLKYKWGVDFLYLLSVWERSKIPLDRHNPGTEFLYGKNGDCLDKPWNVEDVITSGFSIKSYNLDEKVSLNGFDDLDFFRERLRKRGIKLILDFVPNHTSWDFDWIRRRSEFYVHLSKDIIHPGAENDSVIWGDTAQLNYMNKSMRSHLLEIIHNISQYCDGIRCDMAHCVMNDVFLNNWRGKLQLQGNDNLHEYDFNREDYIPEFWTQVREIVGDDFLLIAEAYHGHERELIRQGFDAVYDKENGFYDNLHRHLTNSWDRGGIGDIEGYIHNSFGENIVTYKNVEGKYSNHLVRFLENHDEDRATVIFGNNLVHAVKILSEQYSIPSKFTLLHNGQASGYKLRTPIQLARYVPEKPDLNVLEIYEEAFGVDPDWKKNLKNEALVQKDLIDKLLEVFPEFR